MFSNIDHKAVEALLRGQGCANNLKTLLENRELSSVSTEPLINTILDAFSLALSSMHSPNPPPHHEATSQNMANPVPRSSTKKEIRGIESYSKDSPSPCPDDDGFAWMKYGQKTIKTFPYQRCYYRCAYAKDKNCNATKRVQKIQDNPSVYRTTYMGQHICKAFAVKVDTYGSKMIQFDQVGSEFVMPQLTTIDLQATIMEDKARDHIINQECDVNDFLVDDDQIWANQFPPFPSGDLMFTDNPTAFGYNNPFQFKKINL